MYNQNNLNIPNNEIPNKSYTPSPFTNVNSNEPIVIPHGNIQQNIGLNQYPNYYLNNQPYPKHQIPYQAQISRPNNITSPPKNGCNTGLCFCCTCFGIIGGLFIFFIFLIYNALSNFFDELIYNLKKG